MTLVGLRVGRCSSIDYEERTTKGFYVLLQIGPLVFEWQATLLPFWR